jgi:hypothetical protein
MTISPIIVSFDLIGSFSWRGESLGNGCLADVEELLQGEAMLSLWLLLLIISFCT